MFIQYAPRTKSIYLMLHYESLYTIRSKVEVVFSMNVDPFSVPTHFIQENLLDTACLLNNKVDKKFSETYR